MRAQTMYNFRQQLNPTVQWELSFSERLKSLGYLGEMRILQAQHIGLDLLNCAYGDLLIYYRGADQLVGAFFADIKFDVWELRKQRETGNLAVELRTEYESGQTKERNMNRMVFHWRAYTDDLYTYVPAGLNLAGVETTQVVNSDGNGGAYSAVCAKYPVSYLVTQPGVKHFPGFFGDEYAAIRDRILKDTEGW